MKYLIPRSRTSLRISLILAYAALLYGIGFLLYHFPSDAGAISAIIGFPLLYGGAVQSILDPKKGMRGVDVVAWGLLPLVLLIVFLLFVGVETLICVAIAAAPFLVLMSLGIWLMRLLLGRMSSDGSMTKVNSSLLLLPFAMVPFLDMFSFPEQRHAVVTEIVIPAPVDVVWNETLEISAIQDDERIWTFSHDILGAPQPIDAVLDGGIRQLRWTKGVRFQEHIDQIVEHRFVSWRFVFNEADTLEAIDPHIAPDGELVNLERGFYSLEPLGEDATRLHLETRYRLKTPINAYLSLWGDVFLQDFHRSVLTVIEKRSERRAGLVKG